MSNYSISEKCKCGAEFKMQSLDASVLDAAVGAWRHDHRHAEPQPDEPARFQGDVTTSGTYAGEVDSGLGFIPPSMVDRWGGGDD